MGGEHFLIKVLGFSAVPRIATIGLTILSYPLMVRALGASELGVIVYVTAITTILECFVDLGVSSAAGRSIAVARETGSGSLGAVIKQWSVLQTKVALVGFVPMLAATYLVASTSSNIEASASVVALLVLAAWLSIVLSFARACLSSLLAFKSLAVLDVFEAVVRSACWLAVAFYLPSALGLAVATTFTVVCAALVAVAVLWRAVGRTELAGGSAAPARDHAPIGINTMLRESLAFLWSRLVTRIYYSMPLVLFGRFFGSEVVGVIGVFAKINEWLNFPFNVLGNALAVRAPGVAAKGVGAAIVLWDAVSRFVAVPLLLAVTVYLGAELLASLFLPDSAAAAPLIAILSASVFATGAASLIATMADYVGALKLRNIVLTALVLVQTPAIWLGAKWLGATGAVIAHVALLLLMSYGYVVIALRAFFPASPYRIRSEVQYFVLVAAAALVLTLLVHWLAAPAWTTTPAIARSLVEILLFWSTVLVGLALHPAARRFFLTRQFLTVAVFGS